MNSPLVKVILPLLGGYIIILFCLVVYDWIKDEYPSPPAPASRERIQHPFHHDKAVKALFQFDQLERSEREAIKRSLTAGLIYMDEWLNRIEQEDYRVLCIGELHRESTRAFLSDNFFAALAADILFLEARPEKLNNLINRMEAGRMYFPMLNADIMKILRSAKTRNPDVGIFGIEETEAQEEAGRSRSGSRDLSISENFWAQFQPGKRHIILFGALHCTNDPNWLFNRLYEEASQSMREKMLNVCVLEEHQKGLMEAFVYFMDEIGVKQKNFVIPDTGALHPWIYRVFNRLSQQILDKYCTVVVFRL